jgi:hypothetical protein
VRGSSTCEADAGNEREGGKGAGRNTERRRKENIMDEKDMEDERKDRKRKC